MRLKTRNGQRRDCENSLRRKRSGGKKFGRRVDGTEIRSGFHTRREIPDCCVDFRFRHAGRTRIHLHGPVTVARRIPVGRFKDVVFACKIQKG